MSGTALALRTQIEQARNLRGSWAGMAEVVFQYGGPYLGAERPKGFRQRAMKMCFRNAYVLAFDKGYTYVEGFALSDGDGALLLYHAWVTTDGVHALDPTWRDATACAYFGIAFPRTVVG